MLQFLSLNALDKRLSLGLYCFVISIPLLALHLRILLLHTGADYRIRTWYDPVAAIIGLLLSLVGLTATFFHFSIKAGCVFSGLVIFGLLASHHYRVRVRQANEFLLLLVHSGFVKYIIAVETVKRTPRTTRIAPRLTEARWPRLKKSRSAVQRLTQKPLKRLSAVQKRSGSTSLK